MKKTDLENNLNYSSTERKLVLVLFALLWVFLFIRAIYVPVLHDEIATFFYYIQSDNYMPPAAHWDANNHVLNSMLANICYHIFGSSPLSLRLPNVLFYALFFYSVFQLAGRLNKKILRWGFLLALVGSHYLFEYFGECRGYGISIALIIAAIYHFIQLKETEKQKHIWFTIILLFLATSANLTLIIPTVLIFFYLFVSTIVKHFNSSKRQFYKQSALLFFSALPFILLVKQSFVLKEKGALYYGGHNGFYDITVSSVSKVYTDFYNLPIAIGVTLLFYSIALYFLIQIFKKRTLSNLLENHIFLPFLFVVSVIAILVLSYGLKVNFPEDRAAMYLFPLFVASFGFTLDRMSLKIKNIQYAGLILFYFPILFLFHTTPTGSVFSTEERTSYSIFEYIKKAENDFKFPHIVGGYKTQEFCWYYMNNRDGGNQGKIHTNYHIALDADFQIVRNERINDSTLFDYYTPVVNDPSTKLTLFERNKRLRKELIYTADARPTNGIVSDEFHNILEIEIDTLRDATIYLGAEITLLAESKPFTSQLAVTINDSTGSSLYLDYIPLDWIKKNWDGTQNNLLQGALLHHIPLDAKILKFYIWNIDKTPFSIPDGKCYLYQLERDFPNQY